MGRRKKKHHPGQGPDYRQYSNDRLAPELAGLIERGKYRQSLEVAKEIRRRNLLDPNRPLIERAYRLRALELAGKNYWQESGVMVENAFASGVGSAPLAEVALRCGLATGKLDCARRVLRAKPLDPEASAALLADLAVLAPPGTVPSPLGPPGGTVPSPLGPPGGTVPSPLGPPGGTVPFTPSLRAPHEGGSAFTPSLRAPHEGGSGPSPKAQLSELAPPLAADVARVHRAFALYEKGLDPEAREELSGIALRSPLSRWRLLLRGLLARAAGDSDEARQCWSRIPPLGPCGALARALLEAAAAAVTGARAAATGAAAGFPARAEDGPFPRPRLGDAREALLEEIRKLLDGEDETQVLPAIEKTLRAWPGGLNPEEKLRLVRAIEGKVLLEPGDRRRMAALLAPLPEDPIGLRAAAFHFESDDPEEAIELWKKYLKNFERVRGIRPEERAIAEALVWDRAGDVSRNAGGEGGCSCPICRGLRRLEGKNGRQDGAVQCYRKCLELDPDSIEVRKKLIDHLHRRGRRREAEVESLALLARSPNDVETILRLGEDAFSRRSFRKAHRFFLKAQALEPLNRKVLERLADCLVCSAVRRAVKGRIALARKDLTCARGLLDDAAFARHYPVWAAIEIMYGNVAGGEDLLGRAIAGGLWEGRALWGALRFLGHGLTDEPRKRLSERLEALIGELPRDAKTSGEAADLLGEIRRKKDPTLGAVENRLRAYLEGAAGLPFDRHRRIELCHLFRASEETHLLAPFAEVGRRAFPDDHRFPLLEAQARIVGGNPRLPPDLLRSLEGAEKAAVKDGDRESAEKIRRILDQQTMRRWRPIRPPRESRQSVVSGYIQRVMDFFRGSGEGAEAGEVGGETGEDPEDEEDAR